MLSHPESVGQSGEEFFAPRGLRVLSFVFGWRNLLEQSSILHSDREVCCEYEVDLHNWCRDISSLLSCIHSVAMLINHKYHICLKLYLKCPGIIVRSNNLWRQRQNQKAIFIQLRWHFCTALATTQNNDLVARQVWNLVGKYHR